MNNINLPKETELILRQFLNQDRFEFAAITKKELGTWLVDAYFIRKDEKSDSILSESTVINNAEKTKRGEKESLSSYMERKKRRAVVVDISLNNREKNKVYNILVNYFDNLEEKKHRNPDHVLKLTLDPIQTNFKEAIKDQKCYLNFYNSLEINGIDSALISNILDTYLIAYDEIQLKLQSNRPKNVYFYGIRPETENDQISQYCILFSALNKLDLKRFAEYSVLLKACIINDVIQQLHHESIKSAVSAIMARNMSHNLGSHFISNTKNYFGRLAENDKEEEQRQREYRGIKHTLQYIQERMDFIATIVSTDKFPYGPVNVKSQIFDELTPDEFGQRHKKHTKNFLLDYIVFSESISRHSDQPKKDGDVTLKLQLITEKNSRTYVFGSDPSKDNEEKNNNREEFANMNFAIPGGILGRHAIFTIIENIIRNSAKHDKESLKEDLKISIRIDDKGSNGKSYITIFDNKNNANKVQRTILDLYKETKVLSEDGSIDKGNKGLKEILISALWLNNIDTAHWLSDFDSTQKTDKLERLKDVLEVVAVNDNGIEDTVCKKSNLGYRIYLNMCEPCREITEIKTHNEYKYLLSKDIENIYADIIAAKDDCFVFTSESKATEELDMAGEEITINDNNGDDKVILRKDTFTRLSDIFPRFIPIDNKFKRDDKGKLCSEELFKAYLSNKYTEELIDNINLKIFPDSDNCYYEGKGYKIYNRFARPKTDYSIDDKSIVFKHHLSLSDESISDASKIYDDASYLGSISGGDFTHTITQPFFLDNAMNRFKVIESALTKIAIIDERIFKNYANGVMPTKEEISINAEDIFKMANELRQENKTDAEISVAINEEYNLYFLDHTNIEEIKKTINIESGGTSISVSEQQKLSEKNGIYIYNIDVKDSSIIAPNGAIITNIHNPKEISKPLFLSIHLSLIEGLVNTEWNKENRGNKTKSDIIKKVVSNLKRCFGDPKFMMVHSGRGNLSKDLEEDLSNLAFLSLSAIEVALSDSKYFLSQLLNSSCYFGKGRINSKR